LLNKNSKRRIEGRPERRIDRRAVARQDERFEEPGGVGEVPLGRARVGHRLDDVIFRSQRRAQSACPPTDVGESRSEITGRRSRRRHRKERGGGVG